jgi:hypothetical protein
MGSADGSGSDKSWWQCRHSYSSFQPPKFSIHLCCISQWNSHKYVTSLFLSQFLSLTFRLPRTCAIQSIFFQTETNYLIMYLPLVIWRQNVSRLSFRHKVPKLFNETHQILERTALLFITNHTHFIPLIL